MKKIVPQRLNDDSGQMTIFVALIFQVLFVFFAMAINIGLVVHDKINLQNSVDLGAYYATQKIAEQLNAMAHINYQIRQDYKLLAYRLRVVGGLGYLNHPARTGQGRDDVAYGGAEGLRAPVCLGFQNWKEIPPGDNICKDVDHVITQLPVGVVVASFIPLADIAQALSIRTRDRIVGQCSSRSILNWNYAAKAILSYKLMVRERKEALRALAVNISFPLKQMLDMDGNPIMEGVQKTILNNLTDANRATIGEIETFNGLAQSQKIFGTPSWIREILLSPTAQYIFHSGSGGGCENFERNIRDTAGLAGANQGLKELVSGEPNTPNGHSSLGFEKNPWIMAYVGIKTNSSPRKPFLPFGSPINLVARSFAKPFGGRIGPWHKKRWPKGADSTGLGPGETDTVSIPRVKVGEAADIKIENVDQYVPNFSKYPGDIFGLRSRLAVSFVPNYDPRESSQDQLALADFNHFGTLSNDYDPLSFNPGLIGSDGNKGGVARTMEKAAVAPNLFDITYYSIEPEYERLYGSIRGIWQKLKDGNGVAVVAPKDIGYFPTENLPTSVKNQVEHLNVTGRRGNHFYFINNWMHMLTGWHQKKESDYSLDADRLGKCSTVRPDIGIDKAPAASGDCLIGGRTGYSVKFISRDYLLFEGHAIGGDGEVAGTILNPPPEDF